MAHGRNKYRSRESRTKIRQILMEVWDPIGVRDVTEAQNEYDGYGAKIYVMLIVERASQQAIGAYLYDIAVRHMGLSPRPELIASSGQAAALIVELRSSFETH
jgi:hypothetical protein